MAAKRPLDPEERERREREQARRAELIQEEHERLQKAGNRMKRFVNHLILYGIVIGLAYAVNTMMLPEEPWYLIPAMIWGVIVTVHLVVASGVFGKKNK